MFTGIIEETGKIAAIKSDSIKIIANKVLSDTKTGDSIAVNGVCLTVKHLGNDFFIANVSQETFNITTFQTLSAGKVVNLERAMPINGRFGGHIVSGHIDGTAKIKSFKQNGRFYDLELELDKTLSKYTVKKGSIAVNGISLTLADIIGNTVKIAVIPHTVANTTLKYCKVGDIVNIETDILAKYVEKFLSTSDNSSGISMEFLQQNGF